MTYTLLEERQNGPATLESSLTFSCNVKYATTIWLNNSKINASITNIHSNSSYKCPNLKKILNVYIPVNEWRNCLIAIKWNITLQWKGISKLQTNATTWLNLHRKISERTLSMHMLWFFSCVLSVVTEKWVVVKCSGQKEALNAKRQESFKVIKLFHPPYFYYFCIISFRCTKECND